MMNSSRLGNPISNKLMFRIILFLFMSKASPLLQHNNEEHGFGQTDAAGTN